jgi:hypothetical protein
MPVIPYKRGRLFNWVSIIIALISLQLVPNHLFAQNENGSRGSFSDWITIERDSTTAFLGKRYLDPNTLTVITINLDTLKFESDYQVDPTNGTLLLLKEIFTDSIYVSYKYLPIDQIGTVQLNRLIRISELDSLQSENPSSFRSSTSINGRMKSKRSSLQNLRRRGQVIRGVQVGTGRDVSLESGLQLSLEGQLAQNIRIKALLDDRSMPIQPEGTSSRLDEIDQIYVDIISGRSQGRFGDYHLKFDAGKYGVIDRRLEGALFQYNGVDTKVKAAGAVSRAILHTNRFNGQSGVQGPYILTGRNGETDFVLIGGSEKVWINGKRLNRGISADYTINYNRGEITFTPHFTISSESRISVEFEYSPEAFPRNLYAGSIEHQFMNDDLDLKISYMQEGDDYDRPVGFEMTSGIKSELENVGNASVAYIPSADSLGINKGDYTKVDTMWTQTGETYTIFKFVEPDEDGLPLGEWSVVFSEIGVGNGDYKRDYDPLIGTYYYVWVGENEGSWVAKRKLPLPELHRHGSASLNLNRLNKNLIFNADFGFSEFDQNTLSRTDNDQTGSAMELGGVYTLPSRNGNFSPLEFEYKFLHEEAGYKPFARTKRVEDSRYWGRDSVATGTDILQNEGRLRFRPRNNLEFDVGGASQKNGESDQSSRWDTGINLSDKRVDILSRFESISDKSLTGSKWKRANGSGTYRLSSNLSPSVEGEWEERRFEKQTSTIPSIRDDFRYQRVKSGLNVEGFKNHNGQLWVETRQRDIENDDGKFVKNYDELGEGLLWKWLSSKISLRSEIEVSHVEKKFSSGDSTDISTDLATLHSSWSPLSGALTADLNYNLSQTVARPNVLIAYQVPVGQGDYVRVGDEYIYDPEIGDIILRPEPSGEALPTTDFSAALNFDWSPHRLPGMSSGIDGFGWEDISLSTQLEAVEITRWDKPSDIYLMNFNTFQTDSTVEGRLTLRQDIFFFRNSRDNNGRIRYLGQTRLSNLYLTGSERFGRDVWEGRLRNTLTTAIDLETNSSYERRFKRFARRSSTDYFRLLRIGSELNWRANTSWKISCRVRGMLDRELAAASDVQAVTVRPGVTWTSRNRGRLTADFEMFWVTTDEVSIPYDLVEGRPKGRNGRGNIRADYKIGDHITARFNYTIRLDNGREPIHLARMEMSAFF